MGALATGIMLSGAGGAMAAETNIDGNKVTPTNLTYEGFRDSTAYSTVTVSRNQVNFSVAGLQHVFAKYTKIYWENENGEVLSVAYPTDSVNRGTSANGYYVRY